jgi:hypothetical protein
MPAPAHKYAIIGAGPSLDFSEKTIRELARQDAQFLLSDSIAASFLRLFSVKRPLIFTVEGRRHGYLARLPSGQDHQLWAYQRANARNWRSKSECLVSRFKLRGEQGEGVELYSPGTVVGVMLSYAINKIGLEAGDIHLIGADFAYPDNQVYSRHIIPHAPITHRLANWETWQYFMTLKKAAAFYFKAGYAIRTSFEFLQTQSNISEFVATWPKRFRLFDYSPLGLQAGMATEVNPTSDE